MKGNKDYNALRKKFEKAQKDFAKEAKDVLSKEVKDLFIRYPECNTLGLHAYTDYFNDGDTCYYGVRSDPDSILVNGNYSYDREENEEWIEKVSDEFSELVQAIPEELFKTAFGDHIEITFNKNGKVQIDEYSDHD